MKIRSILKITFFFYCILVIGCSNGNKRTGKTLGIASLQKIKTIKVSNLGSDSLVYLSSSISDVKLIPLEFTSDCILGKISKVVIFDNYMYVKDDQNKDGIFKFDMQGKFIQRIGKSGKGPAEHVMLTDFSINKQSKTIYIYDNAQRKLNEYNLDGKYIREIIVGHSADNFEYENGFIYLYRLNPSLYERYDFVVKNMKGKTIAQYFKGFSQGDGTWKKVFSTNNSTILVSPAFSDTVYSLIKDSLYYSYYIDFGKYKIKEEDRVRLIKATQGRYEILQKNHYASPVSSFFQFKNQVYFSNTFNNIQNFSFFNIETGHINTSYCVIDDISCLSFCDPISQTDDALIAIYSPLFLNDDIMTIKTFIRKKIITAAKGEDAISKIMAIKQNKIENMNPIVLFYYVK